MTPDYPHIRKVGRYAFYAPCALGLAVLVAVALTAAGLKREYAREAIMPVFVVAFLALRDIEKNAEKRAAARVLAQLDKASSMLDQEQPA